MAQQYKERAMCRHRLGNRYRDGVGVVSSRIGMKREAVAIEDDTDIFGFIKTKQSNFLLCVNR